MGLAIRMMCPVIGIDDIYRREHDRAAAYDGSQTNV